MQGINGLTVLIVIWYGGIRVMRGDLLVADIVAFIAYLNVLAWPTAAFGWMLSLSLELRHFPGRLAGPFFDAEQLRCGAAVEGSGIPMVD